MGLTFVPLTLTAVHHLRNEDSGIGSGVLNTMQQVGGSLGLATLSTVAVSAAKGRGAELGAALQAKAAAAGSSAGVTPEQLATLKQQVALQAQTHGYTRAFLVGAAMVLAGAVIVLIGLTIRHEDLATDGQPAVHAG
jgi:hypothetical protein